MHDPPALVFYLRANACTFRNSNLNRFDFVVNLAILFKIRGVQEAFCEIQDAESLGNNAQALGISRLTRVFVIRVLVIRVLARSRMLRRFSRPLPHAARDLRATGHSLPVRNE